ncbi:hypothetical protein Golax_003680 [Gossypium laxum]|uniref:Uncharacterized protein n=1 Tax=Gossypium laxum TaxID=34288 RepID=A0A7J9AG68_9ROSI|nr:hypothetical protein [Gossypium laxum]
MKKKKKKNPIKKDRFERFIEQPAMLVRMMMLTKGRSFSSLISVDSFG